MSIYKKLLEEYFCKLGIDLNNKELIEIHNNEFYGIVFNTGFLGLGESYMAGYWDSKCLDTFLYYVLLAQYDQKTPISVRVIAAKLFAKAFNLQSVSRAFQIGRHHYDIGNDLYKLMLDKELNYSCAYWKNADTLELAQERKLDLICRKLNLEKGMKVLDIGCGWGSFARYACRHYGVEVEGYTVSVEQKKLADELNKGLPIKIHLQDYREISGNYDRVAAIGVLEHIGYKNYDVFFNKVASSLTQDGLALIHTIGNPYSQTSGNVFINKYIFPNSMAASIAQISKAVEHIMVIEDLHNIGPHYDLTCKAWYNNFIANWDQLKDQYTEEFKRMWEFYLLTACASFRARDAQLWQIVLSKPGAKQLDVRQS
ncbi:MAG: cyclopropane fatty acyl phospholipid synthase [Methylobacter sp.]